MLKDGNLFFEFKAPLHLCHPKKVLSVICETCFNADYYDDIFYSQFKAERTYTPQIEEIPQKTKDTAWNIFQETLKECGQYIEYFEQKRLNYLALDSICIALTKIDYVFSQYHFNFYDFSDIKILGASDQEFVDPQHGTDKLFLRLAIYMAERDPLLSKYFDLERLNKTLRETKGDYLQLQ